ncbi:FxLYD domain-containing protein [Halobacteriaceae archaeon SHR40]|uniref:FxLYD domain-containing protein n=1 Tax=Halovenus amylolytica TaxID=2500550 RepID=UPI000FE2E76E
MNRRAFVLASSSLYAGLSGCLGDSGGEEEEPTNESAQSPLREVTVDSEYLLVEREALVAEDDATFVTVSVKNTSQSVREATIRLQMRDEDRNPVGTEYTTPSGPIEAQETVTVRIDLDERPDQVGGYDLEVTERAL